MSRAPTPPWLPRVLLRRLLPAAYRTTVDGDLLEGFERRAEALGAPTARRWYWRQLFSADLVRLRKLHRTIPDKKGPAFAVRPPPIPPGERRRGTTMEALLDDLRFSIRTLIRAPLVSGVAVITLALGIGANTAMYSVIHAAVLSPLPYPEPDRLARIYSTFEGRVCCVVSVQNYLDLRERQRSFEDLVAYNARAFSVTGGDAEPMRVNGYAVTDRLLEHLGASPQIGRFIEPADDRFGAEPVVVISDRMWRDRMRADPAVLGNALVIDSVPRTIIGVAPPGFTVTGNPDLFVPFAWDPETMPSRGSNFLIVIGRLPADTGLEAAMDEIEAIYADLVRQYPDQIVNDGVAARTLDEWLVGASRRRPLLVLWGAVAMVLLVACTNVVNLMLVRAEARQTELGIRAALGASRGRLLRHFLSESMVLSATGAVLGVVGAWGGLRLLLARYGSSVPRSADVSLGGEVLLFGVAITALTGITIGILPVLHTGSTWVRASLAEGGRGSTAGRSRLRQALIVLEVGAALVLVVGAGLMLKSFWRLSQVDIGARADRIMTARVTLPTARYPEQSDIGEFYAALADRVGRLPEVEAVGLTSAVPFSGTYNNFSRVMPVEDPERVASFVESRAVSSGFFAALELTLLQGRDFGPEDNRDSPPVVIVNRSLAERIFADGQSVGSMITPAPTSAGWRVVGVVENLREHGPDRRSPPTVYFTHQQGMPGSMALTVRTAGEPLDLASDVRGIVRDLDPELPVFGVDRLDRLIDAGLGARRFSMSLLSIFAGLALSLGAVGIYGVMAYTVERRAREIGLRQALGASRGTVLRLIVGQGAQLAAIGIAIGLLAAYLLRSTLGSLLFEVSSLDPAVHIGVAALLAVVAVAACAIPAARAAAVDPAVALRD